MICEVLRLGVELPGAIVHLALAGHEFLGPEPQLFLQRLACPLGLAERGLALAQGAAVGLDALLGFQ